VTTVLPFTTREVVVVVTPEALVVATVCFTWGPPLAVLTMVVPTPLVLATVPATGVAAGIRS
jgi:hypothetical protein